MIVQRSENNIYSHKPSQDISYPNSNLYLNDIEYKFEISESSAFSKVQPRSEIKFMEHKRKKTSDLHVEKIGSKLGETDNSFIELKGKELRKLSNETYEKIFHNLIEELKIHGKSDCLLNEHPKVNDLSTLPGTIYFLKVDKRSRRPPHIGIQFRSYCKRHYTTIDRENPIICKVKEYECQHNNQFVYRLYHYYSGNKRRTEKKRKLGNIEFSQVSVFPNKKRVEYS